MNLFHAYATAVLLAASATCSAGELSFTLPSIDVALDSVALHAKQYPPKFASEAQRKQIESELKQLVFVLDTALLTYPDDPAILFRDAFANGMAFNLDFPGCERKAIDSYERLLALRPNDKIGNYYYGAFLAGTTLFPQSVKYLDRAVRLGEPDAHYGLAFVYLKLEDRPRALIEFREFLKVAPDNDVARSMVEALEAGTNPVKTTTVFPPERPASGGAPPRPNVTLPPNGSNQ